MLGRVKRRLSRAKSVPIVEEPRLELSKSRALTLTPSDELIISRLASASVTETVEETSPQISELEIRQRFERTVFNNVESGFLSLPTEILMFLKPYLTLTSEVTLRHTCSRFLNLYTTGTSKLMGDELFQFLCMKERDQEPMTLDRLVCVKCRAVHPRNTFASAEIKLLPTERECRQIWLCPHRHMGFKKTQKAVRAGVEAPFRVETLEPCSKCRDSIRSRSVADRPDKGTTILELENPKSESMIISKIALLQAHTPVYNARSQSGGSGMYQELFQAKAVENALKALNFRLCSHLKLGDPYILSKFCRACINIQKLPPGVKGPVCISEHKREIGDSESYGKCKGSCYTRSCKTKFMFQSRESLTPDASGRRQIWLIIVVYRWLGPLLTAGKDKNWYGHASDHNDRVEMKSNWMEWERSHRGNPCLPNWSICLLHPDDANLR